MGRNTEYKEIGGVKYICKMLPGDVAIELELEIVQRVGRPATAMMSRAFLANPNASTTDDLGTSVEGLIAGGLNMFLNELTPKEACEYMRRTMEGVLVEDIGALHEPEIFAEHFRGDTKNMKLVFLWAMEVNFRDFFSAAHSHPLIGSLIKAARAALKAPTPAPLSEESSSRQTVSMTQPHTVDPKPG